MRHKLISAMLCMTLATSCVDMDIAPKNIVTSESLLSNESGMDIYMARLYSNMPWEDFKYLSQWGVNFNGWLNAMGIDGTGEAMTGTVFAVRLPVKTMLTGARLLNCCAMPTSCLRTCRNIRVPMQKLLTTTIWAKPIMCVPQFSMPWPVVLEVSLW